MAIVKFVLSLLFIGCIVAEEVAIPNDEGLIPDDDYIPSEELSSDENDEDLTRGISRPSCHFNGNAASCCLGVGIKGSNHQVCIELALRVNEVKAVASLRVDNHVIVSKDASVGKVCAPLPPPLSILQGCLQIYHADVNIHQKYANVCFVVDLKPLLQVRFDCFRLRNGRFDHHSENPPEKHGLINIGWHNGKPSFHINKPKWIGKIIG